MSMALTVDAAKSAQLSAPYPILLKSFMIKSRMDSMEDAYLVPDLCI
jgi:hypothetical protein